MYPHRGDEEFFDIFMSTLSELVDDVCPPDNCPSFTQEPEPLEGGWTLDPMMSALSLSKEAVGECPYMLLLWLRSLVRRYHLSA